MRIGGSLRCLGANPGSTPNSRALVTNPPDSGVMRRLMGTDLPVRYSCWHFCRLFGRGCWCGAAFRFTPFSTSDRQL